MYKHRPSLVAVPAIAITLLVLGMTRSDAYALTAPTVKSATTGVTEIDKLLDRVNQRAAERMKENSSSSSKSSSSRRATAPRSSSSSLRPAAPESSAAPLPTLDEFRAEVFRLVNVERANAGLTPYIYNDTLESSAQEYALHMEETTCFSHTECGSTLKERMHASGYYKKNGRSYSYGENIARGQKTAAQVMEDWLDSPPHKAAILSTTFKEMGVGKSGTYWVQHFGAVR